MKWFSIYKDGTPNRDQRVLAYSETYRDKPELAFRILEGQFVPMCSEVTHYAYLTQPIKTCEDCRYFTLTKSNESLAICKDSNRVFAIFDGIPIWCRL